MCSILEIKRPTSLKTEGKSLIAEGNSYTIHWTWRGLAGVSLEPSPLLTSVRDTGRYSALYQRGNKY